MKLANDEPKDLKYIKNLKVEDCALFESSIPSCVPPSPEPPALKPLEIINSCCMANICKPEWNLNKCLLNCDTGEELDFGEKASLDLIFSQKQIERNFTQETKVFCAKDLTTCIFNTDKVVADYYVRATRGSKQLCYFLNFTLAPYDHSVLALCTNDLVINLKLKKCGSEDDHIVLKDQAEELSIPSKSDVPTNYIICGCIPIEDDFDCSVKYEYVVELTEHLVIILSPGSNVTCTSEIAFNCPCAVKFDSECSGCGDPETILVCDDLFSDSSVQNICIWTVDDFGETIILDNTVSNNCISVADAPSQLFLYYNRTIENECSPECTTSHKNTVEIKRTNCCTCESTSEVCTLCTIATASTNLVINCLNFKLVLECFNKVFKEWCLCKTACPQEVTYDSEGIPTICIDYQLDATIKDACTPELCVKLFLNCLCDCKLFYTKTAEWKLLNLGVIIEEGEFQFKSCADLLELFSNCFTNINPLNLQATLDIPSHEVFLFDCSASTTGDVIQDTVECTPGENIGQTPQATVIDTISVCDCNGVILEPPEGEGEPQYTFSPESEELPDGTSPDFTPNISTTYNYKICITFDTLQWDLFKAIPCTCLCTCLTIKNKAELSYGDTTCSEVLSVGGRLTNETYSNIPLVILPSPLNAPIKVTERKNAAVPKAIHRIKIIKRIVNKK